MYLLHGYGTISSHKTVAKKQQVISDIIGRTKHFHEVLIIPLCTCYVIQYVYCSKDLARENTGRECTIFG